MGSAVESNGISQASDPLMLDESAREGIEARVKAMGPRERVAWADEVTKRLRGCVVDVVDAHFTFEERKRVLLETLQEAAFGGAWRINGYQTWDEYWSAEFTEAKLFDSVSERNELISHLKSNGFSQRQIAPIVGLSHVGVLKVLKQSEIETEGPQPSEKATGSSQSGQLVTKLPVAHPESSQSSESEDDDDYLSRPVVHGINDRDQAVPRSADEIARDYLWLSGLKWFDGLSSRAVAERTGLPRKTVAYTLDRGAVEYKAVGRVWLEVMRLHGEGRSLAAISQETGIQLAGVRYVVEVLQGDCDAENAPAPLWIRDIVSQKSLEDWWGDGTSHDHPLKLEDGRDTSVGELASLLKISQPRVTQSLESWAMEIGLPDRKRKVDPDSVANADEYRVRPEADWRVLVGVKEDAVVASESWQADQLGRDMWQQFHRKPSRFKKRGEAADSSPSQWIGRVEYELELLEPPVDELYLNPLAGCLKDALPQMAGWFNRLGIAADCLGYDNIRPVYDAGLLWLKMLPSALRRMSATPNVGSKGRRELFETARDLKTVFERMERELKEVCAEDVRSLPPGRRLNGV